MKAEAATFGHSWRRSAKNSSKRLADGGEGQFVPRNLVLGEHACVQAFDAGSKVQAAFRRAR